AKGPGAPRSRGSGRVGVIPLESQVVPTRRSPRPHDVRWADAAVRDLPAAPRWHPEDFMRARGFARWLVLAWLASAGAGGLSPARAATGSDPAPESRVEPGDPSTGDESQSDEEDLLDESSRRDPFENLNRNIFSFNR